MTKPIPTIDRYMTTTPVTVEMTETLAQAQRLMNDQRIRHLPVMQDGALKGMITERDIALISTLEGADLTKLVVADAMTPEPYHVSPRSHIDEVVLEMAEKKYGSAVVVDNNRIVGIFTAVDALTAFAHLLQTRLAK